MGGKNRHTFEKRMFSNILRRIGEAAPEDAALTLYQGYMVLARDPTRLKKQLPTWHLPIRPPTDDLTFAAMEVERIGNALKLIPGIHSYSPVKVADRNDWDGVRAKALALVAAEWRRLRATRPTAQVFTFRAECSRSDKSFHMTSPQITSDIGGYVVGWFDTFQPHLEVDLARNRQADIKLSIKIRQESVLMWLLRIPLSGGLPVGTTGKVLVLLSGGFDSPVASERVMNRGCTVDWVHFDGYPYTSQEVITKVRRIQRVLNAIQPPGNEFGNLYTIPFSKIQEAIRDVCPEAYRTVMYRIFMMKLASRLACAVRALALVTGDNMGQVASQTLGNLMVVDRAATKLVLRPLLAWNKCDIMARAREIGTHDLSSSGGTEDCCTVFAPVNPSTSADPRTVERCMKRLEERDIEGLLDQALKDRRRHRRDDIV
eukprot:NODE_500_length_1412_cov_105.082905_g379_i0.p1 GENE.NODE_500_length_1412_cov_105.082905_g379_i0~~NODE_500_length_1412_cov_105.082905_g379_i0.p1  ORF type:complete len:430 (-),score=165.60 NODE_500_length_1412_cov_105.082905_g379_i0:94-1383(-)